MAFVDPGVVAELCDPALSGAVGRPAVHEPVHDDQADHGVRVAVHTLQCTVGTG